MKSALIIFALASVSLLSCKQEYTCVCRLNDPGVSIEKTESKIEASSESKAAEECVKGNKTFGTAVTVCAIK